MSAILKYFTYTDLDGLPNKFIAIEATRQIAGGVIRAIKGTDGVEKLIITREILKDRTSLFKPKLEGIKVTEISKEQYDSIDVSKESFGSKLFRLKNETWINKLYNKFKNYKVKSMQNYLSDLEKTTGLKVATKEEIPALLAIYASQKRIKTTSVKA